LRAKEDLDDADSNAFFLHRDAKYYYYDNQTNVGNITVWLQDQY